MIEWHALRLSAVAQLLVVRRIAAGFSRFSSHINMPVCAKSLWTGNLRTSSEVFWLTQAEFAVQYAG